MAHSTSVPFEARPIQHRDLLYRTGMHRETVSSDVERYRLATTCRDICDNAPVSFLLTGSSLLHNHGTQH